MLKKTLATICAINFFFNSLLHLSLLFGAPFGEYVLGGKYTIFPGHMRLISAGFAILWGYVSYHYLNQGGIIQLKKTQPTQTIVIFSTIFMFVAIGSNAFITESVKERLLMTPLALITFLASFSLLLINRQTDNDLSLKRLMSYFALFIISLFIMRTTALELLKITNGYGILDLSLNHSPSIIRNHLNLLGTQGRLFYSQIFLVVDTFYPLTYALFYSSVIQWLLNKLRLTNTWKNNLILLPILAMSCDWLENICLYLLTSFLSNESTNVIWCFIAMNVLKFIFLYSGIISIFMLSLYYFRKQHLLK